MAFYGGNRPLSPEQGMMWMAYKYPGMFADQVEEPVDPMMPTFADYSDYAKWRTKEAAMELPNQIGAIGAWWARNKILQPFNDLAKYKGVPAWARLGSETSKFFTAAYSSMRGPSAWSGSLGKSLRQSGTSASWEYWLRLHPEKAASMTPGRMKGSLLAQEVRAGTRTRMMDRESSLFDLAKVAIPGSAGRGFRSFLFWNFAVGDAKEYFMENRTDAQMIFSVAKHVAWGAANKHITEKYIQPALRGLEQRAITSGTHAAELKAMGLLGADGKIVAGAERKVEEIAHRSFIGRTIGNRVEMVRSAKLVAQKAAAQEVKTGVLGGLRKAAGFFAAGELGPSTRTFFETARGIGGRAMSVGLSAMNVANAFSGVFAVKNIIDAFNSYQHDMRKELIKGALTRDFAFEQAVPVGPGGTERSRAIEAIQNAGLNARSYLGNEAAIMH
jgi:hypothetical protein